MKHRLVENRPGIVITFLISIILLLKSGDSDFKNMIKLEKALYEQDWQSIVEQHEKIPSENLMGHYYYNLALSNLGQLCNRLFQGRQDFGIKSLSLPHDNEHICQAVYFYYTIGLINEAHHLAYESMIRFGNYPENIKLLAKTNLINGNYIMAERYVALMENTFRYKKWAEKYRKIISDPSLITSDTELNEKIKLQPKNDFFIRSDDKQSIELFLIANSDNRKAFEYKIARLLFEKDIEAIIHEVKYMKGKGYKSIPRHIEEAILIYTKSNENVPDLGGLIVSPESEKHYVNFISTLIQLKDTNKSQIKNEMMEKWGNTFWYYYHLE